MGNIYNGKGIRIDIFGQSHSKGIGGVIEGIPAGVKINREKLSEFMDRRRPGKDRVSTSRNETDKVEILSGFVDDITCGPPIAGIIYNTNIRSKDYENIRITPRPAHSDYTSFIKREGYNDVNGGGEFSGRLTAPLTFMGGVCIQYLETMGIKVRARIKQIGSVVDIRNTEDAFKDLDEILEDDSKREVFYNKPYSIGMEKEILEAKMDLDSVGGIIECMISNVDAGYGGPMFDGVENIISKLIFGVPAVKGIEFGKGFGLASIRGSESNDAFYIDKGRVKTKTNNMGGILGGITNGMDIVFRVVIKPTPSIGKEQDSVNLITLTDEKLIIKGRHDPSIIVRALPVIEAVAAIGMCDIILGEA